jgi:hypothetical protein
MPNSGQQLRITDRSSQTSLLTRPNTTNNECLSRLIKDIPIQCCRPIDLRVVEFRAQLPFPNQGKLSNTQRLNVSPSARLATNHRPNFICPSWWFVLV